MLLTFYCALVLNVSGYRHLKRLAQYRWGNGIQQFLEFFVQVSAIFVTVFLQWEGVANCQIVRELTAADGGAHVL